MKGALSARETAPSAATSFAPPPAGASSRREVEELSCFMTGEFDYSRDCCFEYSAVR